MKALPSEVQAALQPLLKQVASSTEQIYVYNERIEQIARDHYPETKLLRQVSGVGTLIALTFVLTIEDAERFAHSRDVGCYGGLGGRGPEKSSGLSRGIFVLCPSPSFG